MDKLPWVDIETTGLNKANDVILEIGIVLTDLWGNPLAERNWLVWEDSPRYEHALRRAKTNGFWMDMHTKSGLLAEIETGGEARHIAEIIPELLETLDSWEIPHGNVPMCGSSVHFDRAFLARDIPPFDRHFHYRNIDISTIKEMCAALNPGVYQHLASQTKQQKLHRPIPDCHDSINEYRFYLDNFVMVGDVS